ncbi:MAG: GNAT family N-acetyltransferase [Fimbriimonadaceae bacterium]|nr:GNAT family N-acetyltransferase [Fimbriimonadaceae bacterium]
MEVPQVGPDAPRDWVGKPTLQGRVVRLVPLAEARFAELWSVTAPDTFAFYPSLRPRDASESAFRDFADRVSALPDNVAFLVEDAATGRALGCTSLMDVRPGDRGLEIGRTWYAEPARGTAVNPESKLLLLSHAFDTMGAVRVQLKTDARNERSRRAILGIGAKFEGILRKHMVCFDGYVRDTAMYSVIAEEWPVVRAMLLARLAR